MTDRDSNGQSLEVYDRRLSSRLPLRVVGRVLLRRRRPRPPRSTPTSTPPPAPSATPTPAGRKSPAQLRLTPRFRSIAAPFELRLFATERRLAKLD